MQKNMVSIVMNLSGGKWRIGRNYPLYILKEKLGGLEGLKSLLKSIKDDEGHCLVFCNYNILDENTDWYKHELYKYMAQDQFGKQAIWMGWGESTLLARKQLAYVIMFVHLLFRE